MTFGKVYDARASSMMKRYRFRVLDKGGYSLEERSFQATDDVVAVKLAEGWRDGRPCELLSETKRLMLWN